VHAALRVGARPRGVKGHLPLPCMADASTSSVGVEGLSSSNCSDKATAVSLLAVLKTLPVSDLNRLRKVLTNRGGKHRKSHRRVQSREVCHLSRE
jgi:hypothetical protein